MNRRFDDRCAVRVRREAEAVEALIAACQADVLEWVGSEVLELEQAETRDPS
ncbi:MAG: hypothetical protein HPY83_18925 [Anaerolineae bacterium]|nr:hypothetical protein [Anaerolineae bacterium]